MGTASISLTAPSSAPCSKASNTVNLQIKLSELAGASLGFTYKDRAEEWEKVYIPTVLIHTNDGDRLKRVSPNRYSSLI